MRSFQKRNKLKYIFQSKFFLVFLGIVILVFIFNMFSFIEKTRETRRNRQNIEEKIFELEKSKIEFNSEINKLKTEKGIEENVREKFGVAKEGENMIMIVDDKNSVKIEDEVDSNSFFSTFKNWFK